MSLRRGRMISSLVCIALMLQLVLPLHVLATPNITTAEQQGFPANKSSDNIGMKTSNGNPGQRVEVREKRTERSRTFLNADGTLDLEIFPKPVHYMDADGRFQLIDNTLEPDRLGEAVRNRANRYGVSFKERFGPNFMTLAYQGRELRMSLEGGKSRQSQWKNNQIVYSDVLTNVDLIYTIGDDQVKEDILLKAPDAPKEFIFVLQLAGAKTDMHGARGLRIKDAANDESIWLMPQIYMKDAAGALSAAVTVELDEKGQTTTLRVIPDQAWLQAPERAFPVVIDPTLTLQPGPDSGMDTTISSSDGLTDLNLGNDAELLVGDSYASLLKFDLSSIAKASYVDSATLSLTSFSARPAVNTTGVTRPSALPTLTTFDQTTAIAPGTYYVAYTWTTGKNETTASAAASITLTTQQGIDVGLPTFPAGVTGARVYMGTSAQSLTFAGATSTSTLSLTSLPKSGAAAPPTQSTTEYLDAPTAPPAVVDPVLLPSTPPNGSKGFTAGNYLITYTYFNATGETPPSPPKNIRLNDGEGVAVTVGTAASPLPVRALGVNIYVHPEFMEGEAYRLGTVAKAQFTTSQTYYNPPSLWSAAKPATPQVLSSLPTPPAPQVDAIAGTTLFVKGDWGVRTSYFGPDGTGPMSPETRITLTDTTAGSKLRVKYGGTASTDPGTLPPGATGIKIYVKPPHLTEPLLAKTIAFDPATAPSPYIDRDLETPPGFQPIVPASAGSMTAPTVTPRTLPSATPFASGTYDLAYSWVYAAGNESSASLRQGVGITAGQALEVMPGTIPGGTVGMRVYMGKQGGTLQLVATSTTSRALVTGTAEVSDPAGSATLAPPAVIPVNQSALPASTYQFAYVLNGNYSLHSGPSPITTITAPPGHSIGATIPSNASGATIYSGLEGQPLRQVGYLSAGQTSLTMTKLPPSTAAVMPSAPSAPYEQENCYWYMPDDGSEPFEVCDAQTYAPPSTPTTGPALTQQGASGLVPGLYEVRYSVTATAYQTLPSASAQVNIGAGQVLSVQVPPLPLNVRGANLYVKTGGVEKRVAASLQPGAPLILNDLSSFPVASPGTGTGLYRAPSLAPYSGGGLSGKAFISYSFYNGALGETPRSTEATFTFTGNRSGLTVTTDTVPAWAERVRIYVGATPGTGKLVHEADVTAQRGTTKSVNISHAPSSHIALYPVTQWWQEREATWVHAQANGLWFSDGGDSDASQSLTAIASGTAVTADLTGLVRDWAAGLRANNGIMLNGSGPITAFGSSDHPDVNSRPKLVIKYRERQPGPIVTLTQPAAGTDVYGDVQLNASAVSPDTATKISRIEYYANGALIGSGSPGVPVTWTTTGFPAESYTLEARAYDQWGQMGSSAWVPVLTDTFDNTAQIQSASAIVDVGQGIVTLNSGLTSRGLTPQSASSVKPPEATPLTTMTDGSTETFWRSPGQVAPEGKETVRLELSTQVSSPSITVTPKNVKDGLTVQAYTIDASGKVYSYSQPITLDRAQTISLGGSGTAIRLVFSNLKRDITTGLFHAEIAEVSTSYLSGLHGDWYEGTYAITQLTDTDERTAWVSAGQTSPTGQEYIDLVADGQTDLLYLNPLTPGVTATISTSTDGRYYTRKLTIPSLTEGFYTIPAVQAGEHLRIYFSDLSGLAAPGGDGKYYAGIRTIAGYQSSGTMPLGTVQSQPVAPPTASSTFLLEADDTTPAGSTISYYLVTSGGTYVSIKPGQPLSVSTSSVGLYATLSTSSRQALPTLSRWRLLSSASHTVNVRPGVDTVPPTVYLMPPATSSLSGTVTFKVEATDNVGVTKVELYDGVSTTPIAQSTTAPFDLTVNTATLQPGQHVFWAKAYDAQNQVGSSQPARFSATAISGPVKDSIDWDRTWAMGGAGFDMYSVIGTPAPISRYFTGGDSNTVSAAPGRVTATLPNPGCQTRKLYLSVSDSLHATDELAAGECRDLFIVYDLRYASTVRVYTDTVPKSSLYQGRLTYYPQVSSSYPYENRTAYTKPFRAPGPIAGVRLTASGTASGFQALFEDAFTNTSVPVTKSDPNGTKWVEGATSDSVYLSVDLPKVQTSGYTYANSTTALSALTVDVEYWAPGSALIISPVQSPARLALTPVGGQNRLTWTAPTGGADSYRIYRSEHANPGADSELVGIVSATGVTQFTDATNLLGNSGFEAAGLAPWLPSGIASPFTALFNGGPTAYAGLSAIRLTSNTQVATLAQTVTPPSATGPLQLRAWVKGTSVASANGQVKLDITYQDNTTTSHAATALTNTFDWTPADIAVTPGKPVKSVTVSLVAPTGGSIWFDAVELNQTNAQNWSLGGLKPGVTYYYRVTAVKNGLESSYSNVATTAANTPAGLGIKHFWPYAKLDLYGGEGYANLYNGNLAYAATDLVYPWRTLALTFRRTYNAQAGMVTGPLGNGWDHNFNWVLKPDGQKMVLKEGDGSTFTFTPTGPTTYTSPPGTRMTLIKSGTEYQIVRSDNNLVYTFGSNLLLKKIAEPGGNALNLCYTGPAGKLSDVILSSAAVTCSAPSPSDPRMRLEYNAAGYISTVTHPGSTTAAPRIVTFDYDAAGNLVRAVDMEHQAAQYGYDSLRRLTAVTDPLGHTTVLEYAGSPGSVAIVRQPAPQPEAATPVTAITYGTTTDPADGRKATVTDARGFTFDYFMDRDGLLKRYIYPYGTTTAPGTTRATVTYEHDSFWNITKVIDPRANDIITTIAYDSLGNIISVQDAEGNVTRQQWVQEKVNPQAPGAMLNLLLTQTNALGNVTQYSHDANGRVLRVQDALQNDTTYEYHATFGTQTRRTDANGRSTTYTYNDSRGWVSSITDPAGAVTSYTYDSAGNAAEITSPVTSTTRYVYDRLGRLAEVTYVDGTWEGYSYNEAGNLSEAVDAAGARTAFAYDALHRVTTENRWPNAGDTATVYTTRLGYDAVGNLLSVTDPRSKTTMATYDGVGRKLTEINPLNKTTTYTYDAAGNLTRVMDPLSHYTDFTYDKMGRRTKVTSPTGSGTMEMSYQYDAASRLISETDKLGNRSAYFYDAVGRLVGVKDPNGYMTTYGYDAVGNLTSRTDAERRVTTYTYDAANRPLDERRPDGVATHKAYDTAGRLTSTTNGRGQVTQYRYDPRGRLIQEVYSDGTDVQYTYDPVGRMTAMTDWNGMWEYQYNLLGWLLKAEDPRGYVTEYGYDPAGNRASMSLQVGTTNLRWAYEYYDDGRLKSIQSPTTARPETFTYDNAGRLTYLAYSNDETTTFGYNYVDQLTSVSSVRAGNTIFGESLTMDQAGRRISASRSGPALVGPSVQYYSYDRGGQLLGVGTTSEAKDSRYYYDLVGNRHSQVKNDPTNAVTYVNDAVNRLIEEVGPAPEGTDRVRQSYTYDADGNQTMIERDGQERTIYSYDVNSRLTKVTDPSGQVTKHTYDATGRRLQTTTPGGTTRFVYDGGEVLAEADASGNLVIIYTRGLGGRLISQWQKGENYWYHLDTLGSTVALTDDYGTIKNRYGYDEYGLISRASTEQVMNRFTFTGQAWDGSTGLYYFKARYYNPQTGRFVSQDTWKGSPWIPWTQNLYAYTGNSPVNYTDPTGHCPICLVALPFLGPAGAAAALDALVLITGGALAVGAGVAIADGMQERTKEQEKDKAVPIPVPIADTTTKERPKDRKILYHYTSEEGYNGIMASQRINASNTGAGDAHYGAGVYLSNLPPMVFNSADALAQSLWNSTKEKFISRTTHYIAVDVTDIPDVTPLGMPTAHGLRTINPFITVYGNGTQPLIITGRLVGGGTTGLLRSPFIPE